MNGQSLVNKYTAMFEKMNRAVMQGYKAPHKPVLLLAIMDLVEKGIVDSPHIELTDDLLESFNKMWQAFVDDGRQDPSMKVAEELDIRICRRYPFACNIANPFFHMRHEPFWSLVKSDKWQEKKDYSLNALRANYEYADMSEELFELMKTEVTRTALYNTLISMI